MGARGLAIWQQMTTNLIESINSILIGARSLSIYALMTKTFETIKDLFVQRDTKVDCMLRVGHISKRYYCHST